jgi:GntR family transcriptional repressor for pyruvate dehydrogenase complex
MATKPHTTTASSLSLRAETDVKSADAPKVFEEIFRLFKAQLLSGELKPGDRLLPERELSQKLGISRASLREVMRVLALLGVVEVRPGQGTFIRKPDLSFLQDFFGLVLAMQPTLYEHLLEARIAIECRAIRLATRQASPEDHARIADALRRIGQTVADPDLGAEADFEFHAAIVRASQNEVLLFIHEAIASHLRRSHHERREAVVGRPEVLSSLLEDHDRVYEAILTGDPDRAEAVLKEHFVLAQRAALNRNGAMLAQPA